MSETEESETSELDVVEDPEQYVQTRRLQDIFDSRQELRKIRREADFASTQGSWEGLCAYRAAVATYLQEVEPLFHRYDGDHLWYEYDFGTITVEPDTYEQTGGTYRDRGIYVDIRENRSEESYQVKEHKEPIIYEIEGLESLFGLPNPIQHTFRFETEGRHDDMVSKDVTVQIPFRTLNSMARLTHQFLAEIGFELDPNREPDNMEI